MVALSILVQSSLLIRLKMIESLIVHCPIVVKVALASMLHARLKEHTPHIPPPLPRQEILYEILLSVHGISEDLSLQIIPNL